MTATAAVSPEAIAALETTFRFRDRDAVVAYLAANPDLIDLLWDAAAQIPRFIEPAEPIILEFFADPEDEADPGEIFALVPTSNDWDTVQPRLDRLDREWLIDAGRFAAGRFNVDVEFR